MRSFERTAPAAARLLEQIVHAAEKQSKRGSIPSLLELQTICRKTGCALPDLDALVRARDQRPGLMFCGGSPDWVRQSAAQFGLLIDAVLVPESPLIWSWECGGVEAIRIHYGKTDREVSRNTLASLLSGDLGSDEVIRIEQRLFGDAAWRLIWIPHPAALVPLFERPVVVETFLHQRAALAVEEQLPTEFRARLTALGQKLWITPVSELEFEDSRRALFDQVASVQNDSDDEQDVRAITQWKWVAERLIGQIEERRRQYQTALDRYAAQLRVAQQTLEQYRRNWMNGLHNAIDEHVVARASGPAMVAFWDAQKKGPDSDSYLAAVGLPALFAKLNAFLTDRMGEFVNGLGGLASRVDLHRIGFAENIAQWNPRPLAAKIGSSFDEKRVFPDGGGKRSGLVGSLTGKNSAVVDERKGQVSRAGRTLAQIVETDFASWSESFVRAMTDVIALQLTAALANKNLPDPDGMKAAIAGLDQLTSEVRSAGGVHEAEALAAEWIQFLAGRHWFAPHTPRHLRPSEA